MEISDQTALQNARASAKPVSQRQEGKKSWLGPLLCWLYGLDLRTIRSIVRLMLLRIERGELYSLTLRDIMLKHHGVDIGLYTMGAPFVPGAFRRGAKIGRFCSIFETVRAFNANHPMNLRSTHAFFYNPALGLVGEDLIERPPVAIGNDVLVGHNAIILPSVRIIGDGAVIGAGSVVHEDVPPYAVVVGHPGRIVRYRFKKEVIADLLASRWWDKPIAELVLDLESFRRPLDSGPVR
jgi:virginiamycin A acetyltransferase